MPPGKCQHTHKAALEAPALPREADEDKCFGWRLSGPPAAGPAGMEVAAPSAQEHLPELQRAADELRRTLFSPLFLPPAPRAWDGAVLPSSLALPALVQDTC